MRPASTRSCAARDTSWWSLWKRPSGNATRSGEWRSSSSASAARTALSSGEGAYCASQKASQHGVARSSWSASTSSRRRVNIASRDPLKPQSRSQPVSASPGGTPANAVMTTAPGCAAISSPAPNTASSRCGDITARRAAIGFYRLNEERLALAVVERREAAHSAGAETGALAPGEAGRGERFGEEIVGAGRAHGAVPDDLRHELRADRARIGIRHIEIAGVAGEIGAQGTIEIGSREPQHAARLQHAMQLRERRRDLRPRQVLQQVDRGYAVDARRGERYAGAQVAADIDARRCEPVAVQP